MAASLLPSNRTVIEESLAAGTDPFSIVLALIEERRGFKYARPVESDLAPWLIHEYGLAPISRFFDDDSALIDAGRAWQTIRGTPAGVLTGLGFAGYDGASLQDQVTGRRRWHLYQAAMGQLPTQAGEPEQLSGAEYAAGLSDPARSEFFRGYHGYDVRGLTWGRSRWGGALYGDSSGVRVDGGSVKWSHGRAHAIAATMDAGLWPALGVDFSTGDPVTWSPYLRWNMPGLTWNGIENAGDLRSLILRERETFIGFYDGSGDPIGYQRVIVAPKDVTPADPPDETRDILYRVHTGFGVAAGKTAESVAVVFGAAPVAGVKPYKAWLDPAEIGFADGEIRAGETAYQIDFMASVRERISLTLTV